MTDYKYKEITEKIIGSSMKVHSALGNGFQEVIYQRALEIEMQDAGLKLVCQSITKGKILEKGELISLLKIKLWLN